MLRKEITFDRFIRGLITAIGIGLAVYIVNRLSMVLLPFFIAWLLAYMIYPMVKFFQYRLRFRSRILCIVISLLLILVGIAAFLYLFIPPAIGEFLRFRVLIASFISETGDSAIAQSLETFLKEHIDQNAVLQLLQKNNIMKALQVATAQLWALLSHTIDAIIAILGFCVILLYLFFILMDYEKLSEGWIRLIPKRHRRFITSLVTDVQQGMNSYFRGQALVAFCVGILFSIGFVIIDFPLAIGLGMFIGLLNLVPYLQIVGFIPTVLLALLKAFDTGENIWLILLAVSMVFIIVQIIQDGFIVPKIMGKLMGLNPAVILLSLSIWGSLLGVIGLIIALPLTTLLLSYYRRYIDRNERWLYLQQLRSNQQNTTFTRKSTPGTDKSPISADNQDNTNTTKT